jgi:hypothetical protein
MRVFTYMKFTLLCHTRTAWLPDDFSTRAVSRQTIDDKKVPECKPRHYEVSASKEVSGLGFAYKAFRVRSSRYWTLGLG